MERRYPTGLTSDNIAYLNQLYQNPLQYALQQEYQWDEAARNIQIGNTGALVGLTAIGGLITYRVARNHGGAATAATAAGGLVGLSLSDALIVTSRLMIYNRGIQAMECAIAAYGSAGGSLGNVVVDPGSTKTRQAGETGAADQITLANEASYVPGMADLLTLIDPSDPLYEGLQGVATQIRSDRRALKIRVNDPFILTVSRITGEVDEALLGTLVSVHDRVTTSNFSTTPPAGTPSNQEAQAKATVQKAANTNNADALKPALKSSKNKGNLLNEQHAAVDALRRAQGDEARAQQMSLVASEKASEASKKMLSFHTEQIAPGKAPAASALALEQRAKQNELDAKEADARLRQSWTDASERTRAAMQRAAAAQAAVNSASADVEQDAARALVAIKAINTALENVETDLRSTGSNTEQYAQRLNVCSIISFPQQQTAPAPTAAMSVSWMINGNLPADPTDLAANTIYYGLISGGKGPYTSTMSPDPADKSSGTVKVEFDTNNTSVVKVSALPGPAEVHYTIAILDSTKNADTALKLKVAVPKK